MASSSALSLIKVRAEQQAIYAHSTLRQRLQLSNCTERLRGCFTVAPPTLLQHA